jgi:hypothetical protein
MILAVNKYDLVREYEETGQDVEFFMKQDYLETFAEDHGFASTSN